MPQLTNETLARAVCAVWGIDPDARGWDSPGGDETFFVIGWKRDDVQRFVKAFLACSEVPRCHN